MTTEEFLNSYGNMIKEIHSKELVLKSLIESMSAPKSPSLSGSGGFGSGNSSKVESDVMRKLELEGEIRKMKFEASEIRAQVLRVILSVSDPTERAILEMRFITLISVKEIIAKLYSDRSDYVQRYESYRKREQRIYNSALENVSRCLTMSHDIPAKK